MKFGPSKHGGRHIFADTQWGRADVTFAREADSKPLRIIDGEGREVGQASIMFAEPIDTDPETERRAAKQGGCCGTPAE